MYCSDFVHFTPMLLLLLLLLLLKTSYKLLRWKIAGASDTENRQSELISHVTPTGKKK